MSKEHCNYVMNRALKIIDYDYVGVQYAIALLYMLSHCFLEAMLMKKLVYRKSLLNDGA